MAPGESRIPLRDRNGIFSTPLIRKGPLVSGDTDTHPITNELRLRRYRGSGEHRRMSRTGRGKLEGSIAGRVRSGALLRRRRNSENVSGQRLEPVAPLARMEGEWVSSRE